MTLLTPAQADDLIRQHVPRLPTESRALRALRGKILAQTVIAERDQPPFHRVTMDGIAIDSASFFQGRRDFPVAGTQQAGAPPQTLERHDTCIEVMTGAVLPHGCDCVIPVERIAVREGIARIEASLEVAAGLNVHRRGYDSLVDEVLLQPGTRLGSAEIAVIASAGLPSVQVAAAPRIMVVSTGDELIEPGEPLLDWQIRRSNAYAVLAALHSHGFAELGDDHLPDDLQTLRSRLATHLDTHDILILSGGVSMGRFDLVPQVLAELGVQAVFHKIAQRPGKPMWFGVRPDGKAVYALPGNPVSTLICFRRYVLQGLYVAMGIRSQAAELIPLDADFEVKPALSLFLPVTLRCGAALPHPTRGSGDFISLLGTEGFVELPPGPGINRKGELAALYRW